MLLCPDCHAPFPLSEPADCPKCGWVLDFAADLPILLSAADRGSVSFRDYMENYDEIAADDLVDSIQPAAYLVRAADTLFSYAGPVAGLRVCELGLGQGLLLNRIMQASPVSVTGVDIAAAYLRAYQPPDLSDAIPLRRILANVENLPFESSFDLVFASEILEHVLNVGDFLISLHRSLDDAGRAIVRVPYKEDLRQYARQSGCPYRFVHLRTFTRGSLVSMMKQAGFKARNVYYDGYVGERRRRGTELLALSSRTFERLLEDGMPKASMRPALTRLLFRPVMLTAVFEKT